MDGSLTVQLAAARRAAAARKGVAPAERPSAKMSSSKSRRAQSQNASSSRRVDLRAKPTLFESLGVVVRAKGFFFPDPIFTSIGCLACIALSFLLHLQWLPLFVAPLAAVVVVALFSNLRILAMVLRAHFRCKRLVPAVALWRYLLWCSVPPMRRELIRRVRALPLDVTLDPRGFVLTIELSGGVIESVAASLLADALCRQRPADTSVERGNKGLELYYEGSEGVAVFRLADEHLRQLMGTRVRRLGDEVKRAKYTSKVSADTVLGPLSRASH